MIYAPKNNNNLRYSIDATVDNEVSYTLSTNNTIIAYELFIYTLDDTLYYDSGKKTLSPTLFNNDVLKVNIPANTLTNGSNYKYGIRLWQDFLDITVSKGKVQSVTSQTQFSIVPNLNIRVGMYVGIGTESQQITSYDNSTGIVTIANSFTTMVQEKTDYMIVSDFIDQFPLDNLYVRNTPQIYITNLKDMTTKSYTFKGQYIQQQGVPIVSYTFNIWQVSNPEDILLMSYTKDSADIQCFYDGFLNGQEYLIELTVTNEFNITVSTGQMPFTASYDTPAYLAKPQITYIPERNANQVQFQADVITPVSTQKLGAVEGMILKINSNTNYTVNQNLNISAGDTIIIGHWNKANVLDYNMATGVLIVDEFKATPNLRDNFYINKKPVSGESGLNLLLNNPYRRVNSMELGSSLVYDGSALYQSVINDFPQNWNYSTQIMFAENFLNKIHNNKQEFSFHTSIFLNDGYFCKGLHIGLINSNTLAILYPNDIDYQKVISGDSSSIVLTKSIDITTPKFVVFTEYNNYTARIASYDDSTKTVTFINELPFIVQANDVVWIPDSLMQTFGSIVLKEWLLQPNPDKNNGIHSVWDDTESWDDLKYWNESRRIRRYCCK